MTSAMAQNIGVLAYSDDLFLTTLRETMEQKAKELGLKVQFEHAQGNIGKRLIQIQNFAAQKMDAIVVNPVDTMATPNMTKLATDLMNNLLVAGTKIDAVAANNDEMAIGPILALQQAGKDPKQLVIGGIDATRDALREMERGSLAVTVFQDPKARGPARRRPLSSSKAKRSKPLCGSLSSWLPRITTRSSLPSSAPMQSTLVVTFAGGFL
jgi:ABC-type sugar transport system substrate-binding protein